MPSVTTSGSGARCQSCRSGRAGLSPAFGKSSTALLALVLCCINPAAAQSPEGDLAGAVEDSTGARIPSARVVVQSAETAIERQATTNDQGEFRLDYLLPGDYHVLVSAPGFGDARSDVTIVVSAVRQITVTLQPATAHETVNVPGQASSITAAPIDTA